MDEAVDGCVFCRIIEGKARARVLYEDPFLVAFEDANPQAPVHILLVPRKHIAKVSDLAPEDAERVGRVYLAARNLACERGIEEGYRIVVNSGRGAGQSVHHLHFHLLGGRIFGWPPG